MEFLRPQPWPKEALFLPLKGMLLKHSNNFLWTHALWGFSRVLACLRDLSVSPRVVFVVRGRVTLYAKMILVIMPVLAPRQHQSCTALLPGTHGLFQLLKCQKQIFAWYIFPAGIWKPFPYMTKLRRVASGQLA